MVPSSLVAIPHGLYVDDVWSLDDLRHSFGPGAIHLYIVLGDKQRLTNVQFVRHAGHNIHCICGIE